MVGGLHKFEAEAGEQMQPVFVALRVALGLAFAVMGAVVLARIDRSLESFVVWHVPLPHVAVWIVGAVDLVCGSMLSLGLLTRPVGLLLATVAVGSAMTAGRHGSPAYSIVMPLLFVGCVFFAWQSGRTRGVGPSRPPGVQ